MRSPLRFRPWLTSAARAVNLGARRGRSVPVVAAAFALLLAEAWTPAAEAQDPPAEPGEATSALVGFVVEQASGDPVHHATVWLPSRNIGFLTPEDGSFTIPNLPLGEYTVEVQRLGYRTTSQRVEITDPARPVVFGIVADPIVLEGLEVVVDRFERRRRATPVPIRVFDVDDLLTSSAGTMQDFLAGQAMVFMSPCPSQVTAFWCIRARGRSEVPLVYLDERRLIGGLDHLAAWSPQDFQMVEVYARGRHIRVYTHHFMERAARTQLYPVPIFFR